MNGRVESAESTMTLDDQERAITRAIKEAGGRRGKMMRALDQSGFTIHRSDAYAQILERARSGSSAGVAVAYGDRLTRNWRAVGAFYDALEEAGAEVIIAGMPGIDYRDQTGRTMTGFMAVMSDAQYMAAKARGDSIANAVIERGVPNNVPFGYKRNGTYVDKRLVSKVDPDRDGKALVVDEEAAAIVRRIFAMRLDGTRLSEIVRTLEGEGILSPSGRHWSSPTVSTILKNEAYTGVVRLGKRRKEGAHEAIVSAADWRRAQATRAVVQSGRYAAGLAGGLIECSGCGRALRVAGYEGYLVYSCRRGSANGPCPRPVHVSKSAADAWVEEYVRLRIEKGDLGLLASARELETAREAYERAKAERKAFVAKTSILDEDDFDEGYAERKARERELAHTYEELLTHASEAEEMPTSAAAWDGLTPAGKRKVARSLLDAVVVSPPLSRSPNADIARRFKPRRAHGG